jgi:hypothetical protein
MQIINAEFFAIQRQSCLVWTYQAGVTWAIAMTVAALMAFSFQNWPTTATL